MKTDRFRSWLAIWLPARVHPRQRHGVLDRLWHRLYRFYLSGRLPVRVRLHGRSLYLNRGSPYPFIVADAQHFDSGLVALVDQLHKHTGRPLRVIDVGCAVGDTVALIEHRLPSVVKTWFCVDGAEENRPFFEHNTRGIAGLQFHCVLLAGRRGAIRELVRHHGGSAMASGAHSRPAQTLDEVLAATATTERWDLLKCDVDGYDGEVLRGARDLLDRDNPVVIFEWHPLLVRACGQDVGAAFSVLRESGYETLLWFSNRGVLSHISGIPNEETILWWQELLLARSPTSGAHFDIVALTRQKSPLAFAIAQAAVYPG